MKIEAHIIIFLISRAYSKPKKRIRYTLVSITKVGLCVSVYINVGMTRPKNEYAYGL